jgi:hypothetical protein
MVDVSSKKCEFLDCITIPKFGIAGKKPKYCSKHKTIDMIDLGHYLCEFNGCNTVSLFGLVGEKQKYCNIHKLENMVNVVNKRCKFNGCNTFPVYGLPGGSAEYCVIHKLKIMIDVKSKFCLSQGCKTRPTFGYKGNSPQYCKLHKPENTIDVLNINKICKSCNLFRTQKSNDYLCSYCIPDKSIKRKTKENEIKELLEKNNLTFTHDKQITNDQCIKNRPDFLFDCNTYFLILECDEFAHSGYEQDCEIVRMNNISYILKKPVKWIRYNPDLAGVSKDIKHKTLLKTLNENLYLSECVDLSPIYLFYT